MSLNLFRIGFIGFLLMSFNLANRILLAFDRQSGGKAEHFPVIALWLLLFFVELFMILAGIVMLRLLQARYIWWLFSLSALGILVSLAVQLQTRDDYWLAFVLCLLPQMPILFGKNRRPTGAPLS